MTYERPIRFGMVGGGNDAFIGGVHRIAARIDGRFQLVAGALSSTPEKAQASGAALGLDPTRIYDDFKAMAIREARLKDGIEAVAIVTPNHVHYAVAREFLKRGIHVICDKPLAATQSEAEAIAGAVAASGRLFILTHNYTGYPLMRHARQMIAQCDLGKIRVVQVEYAQDWLTEATAPDNKQADWRTDPVRAGGGAIGDIGTHAHNLARYITGLEIDELAAELTAFIPGRELDDDGNCLVRFEGGVKGIIYASQISNGDENNLNIRIYGTKASIEWRQEDPNELIVKYANAPRKTYRRGNDYLGEAAKGNSRTPFAHPEGFIEAFANVYLAAAAAIIDKIDGNEAPEAGYDFPTVDDGVAGMAFIKACVESSQNNAAWTKLDT